MKRFTFLIFLFMSILLRAQWSEQNSGVTVDLWDVCFVDSLTGWAIGDSLIIKTTNGGISWELTQTNFITNSFTKLKFIDKSNGFIQTQGKLFTSFDGGTNWSQIEIENNLNVNDFYFIDENTGWITLADAWFIPKVSMVAKTSDRGNTWQTVIKDSADIIISFICIDFLDSNYGIVTKTSFVDNSETEFFKTKNGGDSWEYTGSFSSGILDLKIIDDSLIIAGDGCLTTSIDQGNNWSLYNDFIYFIKDISSADRENSWFLYVKPTGEHQVYYTDPTLRFNKIYETPLILNAIDNYLNKYCWVVGKNGKILFYKNNITHVDAAIEQTKKFEMLSNYPNPFNSTTEIVFSLPLKENIKLKVFDILGREIVVLANDEFEIGKHEIEFNASNLPSGVYFYNLTTSSNSITKKMLLIK